MVPQIFRVVLILYKTLIVLLIRAFRRAINRRHQWKWAVFNSSRIAVTLWLDVESMRLHYHRQLLFFNIIKHWSKCLLHSIYNYTFLNLAIIISQSKLDRQNTAEGGLGISRQFFLHLAAISSITNLSLSCTLTNPFCCRGMPWLGTCLGPSNCVMNKQHKYSGTGDFSSSLWLVLKGWEPEWYTPYGYTPWTRPSSISV